MNTKRGKKLQPQKAYISDGAERNWNAGDKCCQNDMNEMLIANKNFENPNRLEQSLS